MNPSPRSSILLRYCLIFAIALAGVVSASFTPAVAQSGASEAAAWEVPRTSHGHPDLQGN